MPRTKGAKNKPKDAMRELERVKALFAERGIEFPGDQATAAGKPVSDQRDQTAAESLTIETGIGDKGGDAVKYQCGNCGAALPNECPVCPECGAALDWNI